MAAQYDETPAFKQGIETRRHMFGTAGAEDHIYGASYMMQPVQDIVTRTCFGEIWERPGLDKKTRSIITLAMLIAMGRNHEIKIHTGGALANGVSAEEIREICVHASAYCGIPLMVDAVKAAEEVLIAKGALA